MVFPWPLAAESSRPTQNILSTLLIFLPDFLPTIRRPSFARRRLPTAAVFLWLKSVIAILLSICPTERYPRIGCAISLSRAPLSGTVARYRRTSRIKWKRSLRSSRLCGLGHLSPAARNRRRYRLHDLGRRNRVRKRCSVGKHLSA